MPFRGDFPVLGFDSGDGHVTAFGRLGMGSRVRSGNRGVLRAFEGSGGDFTLGGSLFLDAGVAVGSVMEGFVLFDFDGVDLVA